MKKSRKNKYFEKIPFLSRFAAFKYIFVSFIVVVVILVFFNIKENTLKNRVNSIDIVDKITFELASAHLLLEEIIIGDNSVPIEEVYRKYKKIDCYMINLKEVHCIKNKPLKGTIFAKYENLEKDYEKLKVLTDKRYKDYKNSIAGSEIDQEFDMVFNEMIKDLSAFNKAFHSCLETELKNDYLLKTIVSVIFLILFLFWNVLLFLADKKKSLLLYESAQQNKKLENVKLDLENKNDELEKTKEELIKQNDTLLLHKAEAAQQNANLMSLNLQMELSRAELSEALKNVRKSEEKYSKLFYNMIEGVVINEIVYDDGGTPVNIRIIDVNPSYEFILGYKKEDVVGKFTGDVYRTAEPPYFKEFVKVVQSGEPVHFDTFFEHQNKYFSVSAFTPEKNILAIIFSDITENITLQKDLQEEKDNLENVVNQRTKELQNSLKELERTNLYLVDANKHKTKFLSNMSHELRTPLNAIIGFTDLMDKQYYGEINQKQKEYLALISNSASHLLSLINDILDISKIDSGSLHLELELLELNQLSEDIINLMNYLFESKKVSLIFEKSSRDCNIFADERKIKQILINILTNALKFTPEGGSVKLVLYADEDFVTITVLDTGIGIGKENLKIIFDEFVQLEAESDKLLGGTGIGLPLTKRLVELHNGTIEVKSEKGQGSTFIITFPVNKSLNR